MEDLFVFLDGGLGWYKFPKLWKSQTYGICKGKDLTYEQKVKNSFKHHNFKKSKKIIIRSLAANTKDKEINLISHYIFLLEGLVVYHFNK